MDNQAPNEQSQQPTVIVMVDESGDVQVNFNIDMLQAMAVLQLAGVKLNGMFYQGVAMRKQQEEARKPQLLVPTPASDPRIMQSRR